ncbi:MAG: helix-turn-helix transcriptional regulator [Methylococcaceae bacterium]|nr:helix-turn-helix transcriptional regulator [Methylococcaceae bacterium]
MRHDLYQTIERPSGTHHALSLRLAYRNGLMAILVINRTVGDLCFSSEEIRVLENLCPFLSAAINHPVVVSSNNWCDAEQGLLMFDRFGVLHHLDANAKQIMDYALERRAQVRHTFALPYRAPWLTSLLKTLAARLDAIRRGDANATPAVIRMRNYWGQFEFRGYWLEATQLEHDSLYAANVFRLTPLPLRLAYGVNKQDLSLRESQVALAISLGETHRQIADKLNISERTVIGHSQQIYDKLSIANRVELLALLINQRF